MLLSFTEKGEGVKSVFDTVWSVSYLSRATGTTTTSSGVPCCTVCCISERLLSRARLLGRLSSSSSNDRLLEINGREFVIQSSHASHRHRLSHRLVASRRSWFTRTSQKSIQVPLESPPSSSPHPPLPQRTLIPPKHSNSSPRIMADIRRKLVIVGDGACGKVLSLPLFFCPPPG